MPWRRKNKKNKRQSKVFVDEQDDQIILDDEEDFIHSLKKRFPELDSWVIRLVWDETRPEQVNTIIKLSSIALAARAEKAKLQPPSKVPELLARASAPITRLSSPVLSPNDKRPACYRSLTSATTPRGFISISPNVRPKSSRPQQRAWNSAELRPTRSRSPVTVPPMRLPPAARRSSDSDSGPPSPRTQPPRMKHLELCDEETGQLRRHVTPDYWEMKSMIKQAPTGQKARVWINDTKNAIHRCSDNKLARSAKLCKYFLTGQCKKSKNCVYSHDVSFCQYISLRKMNMKPNQLERALDILEQNRQIWFLNVGRNRVGSKMASMISKVMPVPHLRRLSMDSTAIGRAGMLTIIDAACESSTMEYLDLSDTECCRGFHKGMTAEERRFAQMKREEIVTALISLLNSKCPLKHLYIGHNGFTFREIQKIVMNGNDHNSCLLTLDVHGNDLSSDEVQWVHDQVYNMRYGKTYEALLARFHSDHEDIVMTVCQFCHGQGEANYRCVDWKPKRRGSVSKKKKSVYADVDSGGTSDNWDLYDDLIDEHRYVGRNRRGRNRSWGGRKNGQWNR